MIRTVMLGALRFMLFSAHAREMRGTSDNDAFLG